MTGWDVLNNIINGFPPFAVLLLLTAAVTASVIFIVGFSRHGMDFIKHGLKQGNSLSELIDKLATKEDIARIENEMAGFRSELAGFRNELTTIKVNHFGHLKNFLTELTGILVDKNIFTNENKARLDNHLRDM